MPANVVKTAKGEKHWKMAKDAAKEAGRAEDWAYVMGIFKKMSGKENKESINFILEDSAKDLEDAAASIEDLLKVQAEFDSEADPYNVGLYNGMVVAKSVVDGSDPQFMNLDGSMEVKDKVESLVKESVNILEKSVKSMQSIQDKVNDLISAYKAEVKSKGYSENMGVKYEKLFNDFIGDEYDYSYDQRLMINLLQKDLSDTVNENALKEITYDNQEEYKEYLKLPDYQKKIYDKKIESGMNHMQALNFAKHSKRPVKESKVSTLLEHAMNYYTQTMNMSDYGGIGEEGKESDPLIDKLFKQAWQYYDTEHSNYVPDGEDIAQDMLQGWEEETGLTADKAVVDKIYIKATGSPFPGNDEDDEEDRISYLTHGRDADDIRKYGLDAEGNRFKEPEEIASESLLKEMAAGDVKVLHDRRDEGEIDVLLFGKVYTYKAPENVIASFVKMIEHGAGINALNYIKKNSELVKRGITTECDECSGCDKPRTECKECVLYNKRVGECK